MKLLTRLFPLFGLLLLAAFLRFYRLDAQSFWNDEGNSARLAERSVDLIIAGAAGDIHPPGYYLLLAAWRAVAGQSEFALRGLSAFAGIILVAFVYRLGKQYFDEPAALASAFFAAIHPALIYYSQEARMYSLVAMWGALTFLAVNSWVTAIRQTTNVTRRGLCQRHSLLVVLTTAAGLYTHYSFAFIIIAVNLLVFIQLARRAIQNRKSKAQTLFHWLALQFAALLLFAPWLPTAFRQLTTWPSAREYLPPGEAALGIARWLTLGATGDANLTAPLMLGVGVLLLLALRRRGQLVPLLLWLFLPTGLTLGFGLFSPAFAKFLISAVPALCLLLGNGLAGLFATNLREPASLLKSLSPLSPRRRPICVLSLAGGCLVAITIALSLGRLYFDPAYARADYRGIARYIDSIANPDDAILLNAPNQWEVFTYYHSDTSNVFPVARTRPLDAPAQIAELESIAATHDRLFVIYWGDAQSDPGRVIEAWLNEHTFKAYDRWHGDVRLAAYAVPRTASTLQTRVDALFGGQIALEGYSLNDTAFSPGDILQLTLFWYSNSNSPLPARYKVFVHLIGDPGSPPIAQHDGEPGGGLALTTTWEPGQTIADNHGVYLPLDLPPGDYTLLVGLYSVGDGARLQIQTGADNVYLTMIGVR